MKNSFLGKSVWHAAKSRVILLFAACVLILTPYAHTEAAFTSTHYTITSYSIGTTGSSMSSTNYTITPQQGGTDTVQTTKSSSVYGSKGSVTVYETPNEQGVISETVSNPATSSANFPKGTIIPTPQRGGVGQLWPVSENERNTQASSSENTDISQEQEISNFGANLISGDLYGLGTKLLALYERAFSHTYARVILFGIIVIFLLYVRSRTVVGRKFSPF